jgi:pseudaminic acid synthase
MGLMIKRTMNNKITINSRTIGEGYPVYIIAEISANHNQDFDQAVKIVEAARIAGADAVKVQTYTPDTLTINCDSEYFRIGQANPWEGRILYDLYRKAYMPWEWQPKLKAVANDLGLDFFSTAFDESAVLFLENMGIPAYKIASFEINDLPLIRSIARTGKPIIISTGMATLAEIEEALVTAREQGARELALLKCSSSYPASPTEINLRTIPHLSGTFHCPVGISDHTLGVAISIASVAQGACLIEKHLTLSRSTPGPDSGFSMEPDEFKRMVQEIRIVEKGLGEVQYGNDRMESKNHLYRRSLFVVEDMKRGENFSMKNIRSIRPADGLHTRYMETILGLKAVCDIPRGTPLSWDLISGKGIPRFSG